MKNKGTLATAVLLILIFFAYNSFFNSDTETVPSEGSASVSALGDDLLKLSNEISKASLSLELFSNPAYRSLTDFSVVIPQQPLGRTNPFNAIGR